MSSPGVIVVASQRSAVTFGSETVTDVIVTLPGFVTSNVYETTSPTLAAETVVVLFSMDSCPVWVAGIETVFEVIGPIGPPVGGFAVTDAVLIRVPASRSVWVTVWLAVHVVLALSPSDVTAQDTEVVFGSVTATEDTGTLPTFLTTNE